MESKVFEIIAAEQARQNANIELIASENFVSENVMRAVGSCLTNKYSEGYPAGHRSGNRARTTVAAAVWTSWRNTAAACGSRYSGRIITSMSSPIAAPPPTSPPT